MSAAAGEPLVRKTVTVVFCDVTGFTNLGEHVEPETLRRVMLRYFDEMRTVLERHGGTVEKFIGDAVMAVFGVPVLHEDDALRAVRAADEMRGALIGLNDELDTSWGIRLEARIGINTGEVVAGDSSTRQTITTGDAVNVAARLQQAAQPGEILLGRETYRLVRDRVNAGPLQSFSLKGHSESVTPWALELVHERASGILRRLDSPFVGRAAERDRLDAAYRQAVREERCLLVPVVGGAGIGKTRLAQEFASRLLSAGVLHGRCLSYGEGITFWPLIQIVRDAADITTDDSATEARAKVERLLPPGGDSAFVCERVCSTIGLSEGEARAEESFWALRRLFEAIARGKPLVLVFEDLHWAEPTLLDLLDYLVGWSSGSPILLICLARPELLEMRPGWATDAVLLEPLSSGETVELARSVLGHGVLDPDVAKQLAEAAGGNPLFAEELVRMLADDGSLLAENGVWVAQRDLDDLRVPPSINALLAARLDQLAPGERAVIQCASVVGKEFLWGSVVELAPPGLRDEVGPHLHALLRKHLIEPAGSAAVSGEDSFRFSHILVRDAAYASLPKRSRAELHERFADWVLGRFRDRTTEVEEIVGYHLEQAYRARAELTEIDSRARELAARGSGMLAATGRRALERGDVHAAAKLLTRAASLVDDVGAARLAPQLGKALTEAGELEAADALLSDAIETARRSNDERLATHAAVVRGYARFRLDATGAVGETRDLAQAAIGTFEKLDDELGLADSWRLLSITRAWHSEWGAMRDALERALQHAETASDHRETAMIMTWHNIALYYGPTPVEEAIRDCERALANGSADPAVEGHTSCVLAGLMAMSGRFEEARKLASRGTTILEDLGLRVRLGHARAFVADAEMLAGDLRAAEQELATAHSTLEGAGDRFGALGTAFDLAGVLCAQGRYAEAELWAEAGRDVLDSSDVMTRIVGLAVCARLAAHAGRLTEAESLARRAVEAGAQTDALNLQAAASLALAGVLGSDRREAEASDELDHALELYERKGNVAAAAQLRARRASAATPASIPSRSSISGSG
jgi:class 3 adenylate cyclase/tetratricopeptide (TPR) repeat protein